jgi:TolA-binding protein
MEEEVSLKSKILRAIDMPEQAEVLALKSEVSELKETIASMQTEFSEALKSMQEEFTQTLTDALKPVEDVEVAEKSEDEPEEEAEPEPTTEEAEVEVEEADEEETTEEEPVEEVEEEPIEEEPIAEKGESKQEPIHDNIEAEKSVKTNIYEIMGRNPNGTAKRH